MQVERVEISPDGGIVRQSGAGAAKAPNGGNPWDKVLTDAED
jgi:hypothetical protein